MSALFNWAISYVTLATNFVPLVLYKVKKGHLHPDVKCIEPFLWLLAFSSIYESIFTFTLGIDSSIFFWVYSLLELLCILYFFAGIFKNRYKFLWIAFLMSGLICFSYLTAVWIRDGIEPLGSYFASLETMLAFAGAVLWFKGIFDELSLKSPWDSPTFYFISGLILFFAGTLFFFIVADFEPRKMGWLGYINIILSLFLNFILAIGIWKGQISNRYSG